MTTSRNIVIAGAGIGGLTTALALAAQGYRVTVFEQSPRLEEAGAGLQLSPNATRVLLDLGLGKLLEPIAVAPQSLVVRTARSGREIVRMPLGPTAQIDYGAPYWILHRADLQAALMSAVSANPDITVNLGVKIEDYAVHRNGLTIQARRGTQFVEDYAIALIGADGLWSTLRNRVGNRAEPQFRRRMAWRSLVAAADMPEELRESVVQLWLGNDAHLVHYPVRAGKAFNIVAITRDAREETGWSGEGEARDLTSRFSLWNWSSEARELLKIPATWATWALYDLPPLRQWGEGPVTLVGDAAHPMLPFLAQGAGMAIEDAVVLADCLARSPDDVPAAFRAYEDARRARVAKVQAAARRNGDIYHKSGVEGFVRNAGMRVLGGRRLIRRYSWIYDWRLPKMAGTPAGSEPGLRNEVAATPDEESPTISAPNPRL